MDETEQLRADLAAALTALAAAHASLAAANARIGEFEQQVAKLLEEKGKNSSNSGKPPSSDAPSERAKRHPKDGEERSQARRAAGPSGLAASTGAGL